MIFSSIHLPFWLVGLFASLLSQQAIAQVTAPSQGGSVSAIKVTATTMELKFGTGGTGQGRVVAIAPTGSSMWATLTPADNQFYSGANTYGQGSSLDQGYAVYSGDGNSVVITGLQPRTRYYVINAEYNTDGSTILYNTRGSSASIVTSDAPKAIAPLPVELIAFTGTVDSRNTATLYWNTASERNSTYFALESSADGINFSEIGRITAAGQSSQSLSYKWSDPQRLARTTYYRLRQVDNDGTIYYSGIITLAPTPSVARLIDVFPNPSAGQAIQLLLQGYAGESLDLRVVDTMGRSVFAQTLTLVNAYSTIPLLLPQGLASGAYVLTLAGNGKPVQKRITVSN